MSDLGPDARSILEAARAGEGATDADRARVRRALGRAIAAGGAAAATTTAASSAGAMGGGAATTTKLAAWTSTLAGKVITTLAIVGAVGAGASVLRTRLDAPADPRPLEAAIPPAEPALLPPPLAEVPGAAPAPSFAPSPEPSPPADSAPPARAKTATAGAHAQSKSSASSAPGADSAEDPLVVEIRGMREVQGALQSGDPARALALLDDPSASHAASELHQERAVARIVALCAIGRVAEGRAAAASFLKENPRSPFADRVRGACPAPAER